MKNNQFLLNLNSRNNITKNSKNKKKFEFFLKKLKEKENMTVYFYLVVEKIVHIFCIY
jgi:hypothetical protein